MVAHVPSLVSPLLKQISMMLGQWSLPFEVGSQVQKLDSQVLPGWDLALMELIATPILYQTLSSMARFQPEPVFGEEIQKKHAW